MNCIPYPKKGYAEVLKPRTSDSDPIWKKDLFISNQAKLRLSRWIIIQYDPSHHNEGKFGHRDSQTQREIKKQETKKKAGVRENLL